MEKETFVDRLLADSSAEIVKQKIEFSSTSDEAIHQIEAVIQCPTAVPFWHDDLKAAVAIELIDTIDIKNFDDNYELFANIVEELNKSLKNLQDR